MKKSIIAFIFAFILMNCNVEVNTVKAKGNDEITSNFQYHETVRNGMTYGIWWRVSDFNEDPSSIFIVNLTRDELEVQLLRKQLDSLK